MTPRRPPWSLALTGPWGTIGGVIRSSSAPTARVAALLATLLATVLTGVLMATPAAAHASLVASSPKDGSTLTAAPPEVMLRFNEEIGAQFVTVKVTQGGRSATKGKPEVQGSTVYQPLDSGMETGTWDVTYRVVSKDGHPVSGKLSFTYEVTPGEGVSPTDEESSSPSESSSGSEGSGSSSSTSGTNEEMTSGSSSPTSGTSDEPPSTTAGEPTASETTSASESPTGTGTDTEPTDQGETTAQDEGGFPWWGWVLVALGALALLGGLLAVLRRGDRDAEEDDVHLERYQD